jgi:hypothetical protein
VASQTNAKTTPARVERGRPLSGARVVPDLSVRESGQALMCPAAAQLASGPRGRGGTHTPTSATHPGVHPAGRRRSGRLGLFQLGHGQGRRQQDQAAGDAHPGRPRAEPGANPVLDRVGPATRRRVARHPGHQSRRDQEVAPDQATLADVQAGKVPLAKVNASAYDTVGIDSLEGV